MKIVETLVALMITVFIFSSIHPFLKNSNRVLSVLLEKRGEDRILGKNFEKIRYDVQDAAEIKIFQKSLLPVQLTPFFLSSHVSTGNMLLIHLPKKDREKYQVYFYRNDVLDFYTGDIGKVSINLNMESERIVEKIEQLKFIRKGELIYLEMEYRRGTKRYRRIERMKDFSIGNSL